MIIYGSKATQLARETQFEKCKNCGATNSVDVYVIQKYAHVFWIPFVPIGKTGVSQCSHCKQTLRLKEMPESLRSTYDVLKRQTKAPAWTFIGIGVLALLIIWGVVSIQQDNARNKKLVQEPRSGDIYEVKSGDNYTLYKVDEVRGDTVTLLLSMFETNKTSGLHDIKKKGNGAWSPETEAVSKAELKQMFSDGKIIDVERTRL